MSHEEKGQFIPEQKKSVIKEEMIALSPAERADKLIKKLEEKALVLIKKIIKQKKFDIQETDQNDIAQQVSLAVWQKIKDETFNGTRANLETYLYRAVINAAMTFNKQKQRRYPRELDLNEFSAVDTTTLNEIAGWIDKEYLQHMISQLPVRMRQVVELKSKGYMENEIAEELNMAEGTVKSTNFKAIKKLREIIAKDKKNNAE